MSGADKSVPLSLGRVHPNLGEIRVTTVAAVRRFQSRPAMPSDSEGQGDKKACAQTAAHRQLTGCCRHRSARAHPVGLALELPPRVRAQMRSAIVDCGSKFRFKV